MKKFQLLNAFKLVIVQSFQKFHGATQDHYLLRKSTFKSRVQLKKSNMHRANNQHFCRSSRFRRSEILSYK